MNDSTRGFVATYSVIIWVLLVLLALYLFMLTVNAFKEHQYIGSGASSSNTITVTGEGESTAKPDIATFSFTVESEKLTAAAAQSDSATKANAIIAYLKSAGVADKDVQTSGYNVYPDYQYSAQPAVIHPCTDQGCPPDGNRVLKGYIASENVSVKVRDTAKAGDVLSGVGTKGATNISSLQLTFDDPQKITDEARAKAISTARQKANTLASQLGVDLVRVTSFQENGGGMPPIAYKAMNADAAGTTQSTAPEIATGENKVTSNVTITYEIR